MTVLERAIRGKYRYEHKGQISTEDLWDLNLKSLDTLYGTLSAELEKTQRSSLLELNTNENFVLQDKIEIVRYVFETKQAEALLREEAITRKARKQRLMEILEDKQDEGLRNMTATELREMIASLG